MNSSENLALMVGDEQVSTWLRALEKSSLWCWIIEYIDGKELISYWYSPQHCKIALSNTFSRIHFHVRQRLVLSICAVRERRKKKQHPASWVKGFLMITVWNNTRTGSCFPSCTRLQSSRCEIHNARHCLVVHRRMVTMVYLAKWQ